MTKISRVRKKQGNCSIYNKNHCRLFALVFAEEQVGFPVLNKGKPLEYYQFLSTIYLQIWVEEVDLSEELEILVVFIDSYWWKFFISLLHWLI